MDQITSSLPVMSPENTPAPASPQTETVEKTKASGPKTLVIAFVLMLVAALCFALGAGAMWLYNRQAENRAEETDASSDSDEDGTEDSDAIETPDANELDEESEDSEEETLTEYEGDYLSASLPEGWTIVEYLDGTGTDMLTTGVAYFGLTGVELIAPSGTPVFTLEAVYGVGGPDGCNEYYEFSDSSAAYYNDIVAVSAESGIVPTVVPIADGDYVEYEFFERTVRRSGSTLYWDYSDGDAFFNAACGINFRFMAIDPLNYIAGGVAMSAYQFTISPLATEAELETMDTILESMVAYE